MDWLNIQNKADKTVDITIEGIIGGGFFEDGVSMEQVNDDLKSMTAIEADTIIVNIINSPGGSVLHGLGIIDILNQHTAKKEVNIIGMCASMASVISMVAGKSDRTMTENSWFLVHRVQGGAHGTIDNMENQVDFMKKNEEKLINLLIAGSGMERTELEALMDEDGGQGIFLTAQEAMDRGFVGNIDESTKLKMVALVEGHDYNLPQLPTALTEADTPDTPDTPEFNEDSIVARIIKGVLNTLKPEKNTTVDGDVLAELVATEVTIIKGDYIKSIETIDELTNVIITKDEQINALTSEVDRLTTELQSNASVTNMNGTSDPEPHNEGTVGVGHQVTSKLSQADKRKLNQNADAKADAQS